jgi:hypothetical protein
MIAESSDDPDLPVETITVREGRFEVMFLPKRS